MELETGASEGFSTLDIWVRGDMNMQCSEFTFIPHNKHVLVVQTGFYHLKKIARVLPLRSLTSTETLMHAFISSCLDYCNALLPGLPKKHVSDLQLLQTVLLMG